MIPAICHYSLRRRWKAEDWTLTRLMMEVRQLGLSHVDVHAGMLGTPAGAAQAIRRALDDTGVTLAGLSVSNSYSSDDPDEVRAQQEKVKAWLQVAAEIRAPVCRVFGGGLTAAQRQDSALVRSKTAQITDALGATARVAEQLGLVLALENHGRLPGTGAEQAALIEAINSPALKATIDVGNYLVCGEESDVGTRAAAHYAVYVHFKDFIKQPDTSLPWGWTIKACAVGEGDVRHRACLDALRAAGYNGVVALEYEGAEDEQTAVPRSVAFMKTVCAEQ